MSQQEVLVQFLLFSSLPMKDADGAQVMEGITSGRFLEFVGFFSSLTMQTMPEQTKWCLVTDVKCFEPNRHFDLGGRRRSLSRQTQISGGGVGGSPNSHLMPTEQWELARGGRDATCSTAVS